MENCIGLNVMKDDVGVVAESCEKLEQNNDSIINHEARRRLEQILEERALHELIKDDFSE